MALRDAARGSAMPSSGNTSSIRRIQRELKEISEDPSRHWTAAPVGDDLFEWQFAVRGPPGTEFEGGIYTGRLVLPVNYPLAPPQITLLTPNGRWEVGKKICLSNSSYHPELWQPAWGIRTMVEALRSHFPVPGEGAIGALDWPADLRKQLAKESLDFVCPPSKSPNRELLPELTPDEMREDMPEHITSPAPAAADAIPEAPVVRPAADYQLPAEPVAAPSAADYLPPAQDNSLPDGLRFRGGQAAAPAATATAQMGTISEPAAPVATQPMVAASASTSSAAGAGESGNSTARRRQNDGTRAQRRPNPVFMQLLKPPSSRRDWVLLMVDTLIFLATLSFMVVLIDIFRNPPKLLNPLPEQRDPQN